MQEMHLLKFANY